MGRMFRFLRAYRRRIAISLLLAYATFVLIHPDEEGRISDLIWFAVLVMFIASQIFWIKRIIDLVARFLPSRIGRTRLAVVAALIYLFVYAYSYPGIQSTNDHIFRTGYDRPLYVNRGIGITGFPIRLGARPEITVFELTRGA